MTNKKYKPKPEPIPVFDWSDIIISGALPEVPWNYPPEIELSKPSEPDLSKEHFIRVLKMVEDQVFDGKGKERHGKDLEFKNQPWKFIADHVGPEFLRGQSVKKILELKNLDNLEAYRREILGAIAYLVMDLMHKENGQDTTKT